MKRDRPQIVISAFDHSGNLVKPWAQAGYECHIIDIQHPVGKSVTEDGIIKWGMDVREWENVFFKENPDAKDRVVFAAFFPPCTDLAVSGARWFEEKEQKNPGSRQRAMDLVYWSDACGKRLGCPYFIENPVSVISTEWRKPDFTFHPFWYGGYVNDDAYTKKTCLWTGGGFTMPPENRIALDPKTKDKIHKMAPGKDRANKRSLTPMGWAQACFEKFKTK